MSDGNIAQTTRIHVELDKAKAWIVGLIILGVIGAGNIASTIVLAMKYEAFSAEDHHLSQLKWLHDSDLADFQRGPFNDLKTEVEVNQKLFMSCNRGR